MGVCKEALTENTADVRVNYIIRFKRRRVGELQANLENINSTAYQNKYISHGSPEWNCSLCLSSFFDWFLYTAYVICYGLIRCCVIQPTHVSSDSFILVNVRNCFCNNRLSTLKHSNNIEFVAATLYRHMCRRPIICYTR